MVFGCFMTAGQGAHPRVVVRCVVAVTVAVAVGFPGAFTGIGAFGGKSRRRGGQAAGGAVRIPVGVGFGGGTVVMKAGGQQHHQRRGQHHPEACPCHS